MPKPKKNIKAEEKDVVNEQAPAEQTPVEQNIEQNVEQNEEQDWAQTIPPQSPKQFKSVADFNHEEVAGLENSAVKELSVTQLLQVLIVRGSNVNNPNPALKFAAVKLLRQLHGERLHDGMIPRGGGRGGRGRGRGGPRPPGHRLQPVGRGI